MMSPTVHQQPPGLYYRQLESVRQMLNFNDVGGGQASAGGGEPQWKVLVYDQVGFFLKFCTYFIRLKNYDSHFQS